MPWSPAGFAPSVRDSRPGPPWAIPGTAAGSGGAVGSTSCRPLRGSPPPATEAIQNPIVPLQFSIALMQSSVAPLQATIASMRSFIAPVQSFVVPLQCSIAPLQCLIAQVQRAWDLLQPYF